MARAVVALALIAALCGAALAEKSWIVVPGLSDTQVDTMLDTYDVRGHYRGVAIVAGDEEVLARLRQVHRAAHRLAERVEGRALVVFEREDIEGESDESNAWVEAVVEGLMRLDATVLRFASERVFALVKEPLHETLFSASARDVLPYNTEILPVAPRGIRRIALEAKMRLQAKKKALKHNFAVDDYLRQVNETTLRDFIEYLTGERADSTFNSRNSYSDEAVEAAEWIAEQYTNYGFTAKLESFDQSYGPNVIAVLRGAVEPERYFIMGAHYDSRGPDRNDPDQRAPGANDDGSGTGVLLQTAKIIYENNLRFRYSVILGSWCGEEQGLVGSRAYAAAIKDAGYDVVAMIQGDMLAYRRDREEPQCAFPERYDDPDLTDLAISIVNEYVPEVNTCYTSACCSDHQSFYEQGYSATQFFERCGSIADDQYHKQGDLVNRNGYDLDQLVLNARAMLANLLVIAEVQDN